MQVCTPKTYTQTKVLLLRLYQIIVDKKKSKLVERSQEEEVNVK